MTGYCQILACCATHNGNKISFLQTPIKPVIIIGLPRCGTTMLQRFLPSDPKFVSPMLWEMAEICPPGRPENWHETDRYEQAKKSAGMI
jgi:hypothetical protein